MAIKSKKKLLAGTKAGPNFVTEDAAEVKVTYHVNGSGIKYFGGASQWPVVIAEISYPTGWEGNARLFSEKLAQFITIELREIARMRLEQGELTQEDYDYIIQELS